MASLGAVENARTSAAQQLANSTAELLRWLGVPAFAGPAAVWKSGRILPLVWMLAFELGMVSRFSITSFKALAIAAPIIAFLAFLTQPISAGVLGRGSTGGARFLLPLLCVLPVVAFFVVRHTIVPLKESDSLWLWPHYWCDAMLTLVVLYVAMVILLPSAQASSRGRLYGLWAILLFMAFANVISVAIFPIQWTIGEVREHTSMLPLLVATLVLIAALILSRSPSQGDRTQSRSYTLTVSIAVLVLIFGLNNAFMVKFSDRTLLLVATVLLSATAVAFVVAIGRPSCNPVHDDAIAERVERLPGHIAEPRLWIWIAAFEGQQVTLFGHAYPGPVVVAALVVFNVSYLLVVWVFVSSGLDHLVVWSSMEFWRKRSDTVRRMALAAPLLLIAVAFLALTAETWQVTYLLSRKRLVVLCGLLAALVLILLIGWSLPRVLRQRDFDSWQTVSQELAQAAENLNRKGRGQDWLKVADDVKRAIDERTPDHCPSLKIGLPAMINALLVVLMYQFFVFAAIVIPLFFLLLLLAQAVPPTVAAEWIFGDGQGHRGDQLLQLSPLDSPWIRVPLFLTLFSCLYFAAESLASMESRKEYFSGSDSAIRFRFAVGLGYQLLQSNDQQAQRDARPPGRERCSPARGTGGTDDERREPRRRGNRGDRVDLEDGGRLRVAGRTSRLPSLGTCQ
jgi:hypothetical protein